MIIFLDTNVILDIVLRREPHVITSIQALKAALRGKHELNISANCITDIFYIAKRIGISGEEIKARLEDILSIVEVISTTKTDILNALQLEVKDLEDGLQLQCAIKAKAELILTRDENFPASEIKTSCPAGYLKSLVINNKD